MRVKLFVHIKGEINSRELYEDIKCYDPCVTDIGTETFVTASVNITMFDAEKIITTCNKYGECDVQIEVLPIV